MLNIAFSHEKKSLNRLLLAMQLKINAECRKSFEPKPMGDEKEILERISRGDTSAYEYIYKNYYAPLIGFANRFFPEEAHEIVQDTLLKIWENREQLGEIQSLKSYLFRAVRNTCINHLKRQELLRKYQTEAAVRLKEIELDFSDNSYEEDKQEALKKALDEIPEQRRKIFLLSYIEGYKAKEIAEQYNISERTVHTHVYNAMRFLKTKFSQYKLVFLPILSLLFELCLKK